MGIAKSAEIPTSRAELEAWDSEVAEAPAEIDDATREKLKALGYLE